MNSIKTIFRWINIIWAIMGISSVVILVTSVKGHPPGIVFAPIAIVIWIIGHVLFWVSRKLAVRGNQQAGTRSSVGSDWPISLIILTLCFGVVFVFGFFGMALQVIFEHNWQSKLPAMLIIWLPPSICFVGILLRQSWSRYLAGGGFILAAIFLLYQMIKSLMQNQQYSDFDWLTAIVIMIGCLFLGLHIFRSSRVKQFYTK